MGNERDLTYKSIDQIPVSTDTPAANDFRLWWDAVALEWKKQDCSAGDAAYDDLAVSDLTVTATATFSGVTVASLGTVSAATSITTSALVAPTAVTFASATVADLGTVELATFAGGTIADLGTVTAGTIGTAGATVAEIVRAADVSTRVVTLAATSLAVTQALHEGRIILLGHSGASSTATLPEATGSGNVFTFIVSVVNTSNHVIACEGDGEYNGFIRQIDNSDDSIDNYPALVGDNFDTITLNGSTQGGLVGDKITVIDIAADTWSIEGQITSTGSAATPFS